jgi:ABC transporter substrate binding protein
LPRLLLLVNERSGLGGRHRIGIASQRRKLLLQLLVESHFAQVFADLVDDRLGRANGCHQNSPARGLLAPELDGKRQDILMEAAPGALRIAALADPAISTPQHLEALQEAVRARGVELTIFSARTPEEIVPAMNGAKAAGAAALNVLATPLFFFNQRVVIERAAALRMPAMYQWPEMAEAGGLAGYGPRITEWYRQLARVLAKVLRGAKPADLPIEQPTNFELVINLQAAKAIGH